MRLTDYWSQFCVKIYSDKTEHCQQTVFDNDQSM